MDRLKDEETDCASRNKTVIRSLNPANDDEEQSSSVTTTQLPPRFYITSTNNDSMSSALLSTSDTVLEGFDQNKSLISVLTSDSSQLKPYSESNGVLIKIEDSSRLNESTNANNSRQRSKKTNSDQKTNQTSTSSSTPKKTICMFYK